MLEVRGDGLTLVRRGLCAAVLAAACGSNGLDATRGGGTSGTGGADNAGAGMDASAGSGGVGGLVGLAGAGGSGARSGVDASTDQSASAGSGGSAAGSGAGGTGGSAFDAGKIIIPDGAFADGIFAYTPPTIVRDACAQTTVNPVPVPLDMFIMLDQSGSMNDKVGSGGMSTKWTAVTGAIQSFVQSPQAAGIGVGIQYFPSGVTNNCGSASLPNCTAPANCTCVNIFISCLCTASGGGSCNVPDYSSPDVPIQPLPGVAQAIVTSLGNHSPGGGTPTSAALQGAVNYATTWAQAHTDHRTIIVFATDGDPSACDTNITDISNIAAGALSSTPSISTYVIGVGNSLTNLNTIAMGGGTGQAFLVDTGADVNQQFIDAINSIRGQTLGCQFVMPRPDAGVVDPGQVTVSFTGSGGDQTYSRVNDVGSCTGAGWYFDDNAAPRTITLCPDACTAVQGDTSGTVTVALGCLGG